MEEKDASITTDARKEENSLPSDQDKEEPDEPSDARSSSDASSRPSSYETTDAEAAAGETSDEPSVGVGVKSHHHHHKKSNAVGDPDGDDDDDDEEDSEEEDSLSEYSEEWDELDTFDDFVDDLLVEPQVQVEVEVVEEEATFIKTGEEGDEVDVLTTTNASASSDDEATAKKTDEMRRTEE